MKFDDLNSFIDYVADIKKSIYLWGIGVYGIQLGKIFDDNNIHWNAYLDNFMSEDNKEVNGKKVLGGGNIVADAVYVLTMINYQPVKEQLMEAGVCEADIIYFNDTSFFNEVGSYFEENEATSERIERLKNIHKDEKCFVIGNGPSLRASDLDRLSEKHICTFACNRIYEAFEKVTWRPDYYFYIDVSGVRNDISSLKTLKYLSSNCEGLFSKNSGDLYKYIEKIENLYLFKSVYSKSEELFGFSGDCSKQVYLGYTVTYAMLQMAAYMGFKEIYLLGIDHNYATEILDNGAVVHNDVVDHSELVGAYQSNYFNIDKTTRAFLSAKKYSDEHGIKIYNATRGGRLEVFERVDFDTLFD